MNCSKCSEPVEDSAAFCGNCGVQLRATQAAVATTPAPDTYAMAQPETHRGETQAVLSVVFGALGIVGALLAPFFGLALGMAGVVFGTISRDVVKRHISLVGIVLSSLALVAGLATWVYAMSETQEEKQATATNIANNTTATVSTPCYSAGFAKRLTVETKLNSCDMSAFNGSSPATSTDLFKVYANKSSVKDIAQFQAMAKAAIEKDVAENLTGFTIIRQQPTTFAGSPAYVVYAANSAKRIAATEAAVLHQTSEGQNVFVLVHAASGDMTDLSVLEAQWLWK